MVSNYNCVVIPLPQHNMKNSFNIHRPQEVKNKISVQSVRSSSQVKFNSTKKKQRREAQR